MTPYMKECLETFWANQFYNGTLRYTPTDGGKAVTKTFADLKEDGTFDLSDCGDTANYLVITTNLGRFFKVGEENKDKTVMLIVPRSEVEQTIKPGHPFAPLMASWNAENPGMFWRQGNDKNLTRFDSLTSASAAQISSWTIYDNWCSCASEKALCGRWFVLVFENQNKEE